LVFLSKNLICEPNTNKTLTKIDVWGQLPIKP